MCYNILYNGLVREAFKKANLTEISDVEDLNYSL